MAFLVLEGLDGSGKSTLMKGLVAELDRRQIKSTVTREPGGTPLAEEIRQLLLRTNAEAPTPRTEVLLYEASRAQHVDRIIRPALQRNEWVICDRFTASTVAFQCFARKLGRESIDWLNNYATDGLEPDLVVLLDLTVEESERRRGHREAGTGVAADRFEQEKRDFHQAVRNGFLQQAQANSIKWLVIDAMNPPEKMLEELMQKLTEKKWLES